MSQRENLVNGEVAFPKTVPLLRFRGLNKAFGGEIVLDGVSGEIHRGEVVLLRGENGSGKTTLLNMLTGNLAPDSGQILLNASGRGEHFHFPRRWWEGLNPFDHFTPERVASEALGRTWQDVRLFETQTLRDNIVVATPLQRGENPLRALVAGRSIRRDEEAGLNRAREILGRLELAGRETSSADKISLGQAKRVAIARAVAAGAKILFLDEPLAGLDGTGIQSVTEMLGELVNRHRITLVIIEHLFHIPRILKFANTVWTLSGGKLTVETPSVVGPQISPLGDVKLREWIRKHFADPVEELTEPLPAGATLTRFRRANDGENRREPILELRNLIVFRGRRRVIGWDQADGNSVGLSLKIHNGETVLLEAPNGWGKTTLLEAIIGKLAVVDGEILLCGRRIDNETVYRRSRLGMGCMQSRDNTFASLSVRETFRLVSCVAIPSDLRHLADRSISSLSGGERQRVALAAVCPSRFGLYDECFSALDTDAIHADAVRTVLAKHHAHLLLFPQVDIVP
jgi:branched-chain amino acid transport system ATP-binding protein